MTVAICIRCGSRKHGALTPCPNCQFDPSEDVDKARAMILTDHILSIEDLEGLGERIRNGQAVVYPEDTVAEYVRLFEQGADRPPWAIKYVRYGCLIVGLLLALVAVYLLFGGA